MMLIVWKLLGAFTEFEFIIIIIIIIIISPFSDFCSYFFLLATTSDLHIQEAVRRRPTKSIGLDDVPGFIINGRLTLSVPALKYICNLSVSQKHFTTHCKQSLIVPAYKTGNSTSVKNYVPISLVNNCFKAC